MNIAPSDVVGDTGKNRPGVDANDEPCQLDRHIGRGIALMAAADEQAALGPITNSDRPGGKLEQGAERGADEVLAEVGARRDVVRVDDIQRSAPR